MISIYIGPRTMKQQYFLPKAVLQYISSLRVEDVSLD